jgi:hypothetical protein
VLRLLRCYLVSVAALRQIAHSPDASSVEFGNPLDSSLLGRRRPVSPFSQGTYQSMTVSSCPSMPSNVTWKAPASPGSGGQSRSRSVTGFSEIDFAVSGLPSQVRNGLDRPSMHTRNDGNMSSSDLYEVSQQLNRSGSLLGSRSLRSPALPDSPLFESAAQSTGALTLSKRGQLSSLGNDVGSLPPGNAGSRSSTSTPTQYLSRSSASPAFSNYNPGRSSWRSSQQAASPFSLNQSQTLVLSPLANFSRSSLESAGSSYHTVMPRSWIMGLATEGYSVRVPAECSYPAPCVVGTVCRCTHCCTHAHTLKALSIVFGDVFTYSLLNMYLRILGNG